MNRNWRRVLLLVEISPACAGIPSALSLSLSHSPCFRESYLVRVNVLVEAPHRAAVLGVAVMVVRAAPVVRRHIICREAPRVSLSTDPNRLCPRCDGLTPKKHIIHVHHRHLLLFQEENVRI